MRGRTKQWQQYYQNHPETLASWREQNGLEPNCDCRKCKQSDKQSDKQ